MTFAEAIHEEQVVTFEYDKPGEPRRTRRVVSPWEIKDGERVLGWDHDRDGIRMFTLAHIVGVVQPYDEDYVRPAT